VAELGDVPVCVNFVGNNHIVVEPAAAGEDDEIEVVSGSPPEEMYAHFANRRSPGSGRRRRGKHGRRGGLMEAEHFVRIADAEPTRARPLQGLWKVLPPLYAELAHLSLRNVPAVLFLLQSLIVPVSCLLSARDVAGQNREMPLLVRAIVHR
jgi:hypothetical protein